jgi:uncharacterized protein
MLIKIHDSYRRVVAVCDSDLVGKKFEAGKMQLDVKNHFYSGEEVDSEKLVEILKREQNNYATFNIVGEESVKVALESGLISEGNIGNVGGVPFALLLL